MTYIAVRAFRSEAAAKSGKRGRRLVLDAETGTVSALGSIWNPEDKTTSYAGMQVVPGMQAHDLTELGLALATSKTQLVVVDENLTEYVNQHDGQLPLEGLQGEGPDDFVDTRQAALDRAERIASKKAPKEVEA